MKQDVVIYHQTSMFTKHGSYMLTFLYLTPSGYFYDQKIYNQNACIKHKNEDENRIMNIFLNLT